MVPEGLTHRAPPAACERVIVIERDAKLRSSVIAKFERDGYAAAGLGSLGELNESLVSTYESRENSIDTIVIGANVDGTWIVDVLALRACGSEGGSVVTLTHLTDEEAERGSNLVVRMLLALFRHATATPRSECLIVSRR